MILAVAVSLATAYLLLGAGSRPTVADNTSLVVTATLWIAYLVLGATESITRRIDRDQTIRRIHRSAEDVITTGALRRSQIRPVD